MAENKSNCRNMYPQNNKDYSDCYDYFNNEYVEVPWNTALSGLKTVILLPIFFFGGTALIRYLFVKKNEEVAKS